MAFWVTAAAAGCGVIVTSFLKHIFTYFFDGAQKITNDRDKLVLEISLHANDVAQDAVIHWASEKSKKDEVKIGEIVSLLFHIGELVETLFAGHPAMLEDVQFRLNAFDQAVTGEEFDSAARLANPSRTYEIRSTLYALTHAANVNRSGMRRPFVSFR